MRRIAGLGSLVLLLLLMACANNRVERISMSELAAYREARLSTQTRGRLVATLRAPELLAQPRTDDVLRERFRARGRQLGVSAGLRMLDHYPLDTLGLWVFVYEADSERALTRGMRELERHPDIDNVQRDSLYRTRAVPSESSADPLGPLQPFSANQLERLHALATGEGVLVALIDTGIDAEHEDLVGAALETRDLVTDSPDVPPETHATAVGGVIIAQPGNGVGIRGIAPRARLLALRACWQEPVTENAFCNTFTLAKALSEALQRGADVVNLSLTGPLDPLLGRLVADLLANGAVVVAAHADERDQGPFPGTLPGVISATSRPLLAENPGPLFAPGTDVITLLPADRYGLRDGSSISAAQVSAVFSLFLERDPALTADELESLVRGESVRETGLDGLLEALRSVGSE